MRLDKSDKSASKYRAVSPVVGMVLILGIIAGFMAMVQSSYIPVWDKRAEAATVNNLVYEISKLPYILTSSTSSTSITLKVGTEYPKYPLLINSPPVSGSVYFKPEKVVINGTIVSTGLPYNRSYNTSDIIIKPGSLYSNPVQLIYEYGAVFENGTEYSNIVKVVNQTAFSKYSIVIPILNSSQANNISGMTIPLHLYLVSKGAGIPLENLSITFTTANKKLQDYWYNTLVSIYGSTHVTKIGSNTVKLYNISAMLSLPYWSVNAGYTLAKKPLVRVVNSIVPLNNPVFVGVGSTSPFQVLVIDQYGNPIAGAVVNSTVLPAYSSYINVTPSTTTTNVQGIATFYVYGKKALTGSSTYAKINITAKSVTGSVISTKIVNTTINVNVTAPTVTPPPPVVSLIKLYGNVTISSVYYFAGAGNYVYNGTLNATAQALDSSGNPVKNATITFNFESQIKQLIYLTTYKGTATTDNNGYAVLKDVPVKLYVYKRAGSYYAYVELVASNGSISTTAVGNWSGTALPVGGEVIDIKQI